MDKSNKFKFYLLFFVVLLCILFVSPYITYADFIDAVSEDSEIELTLGSVDLSVQNNGSNQGQLLTIEEGSSHTITETIQNTGTLSGKVAYDISLTNAKGNEISDSLKGLIKISVNNKEIASSNKTILSVDGSNNPLILKPGEYKDISITVEAASFPEYIEEVNLNINFLFFQTNGTVDKPLFHDKVSKQYKISTEQHQKDYWPTNGWINHGNVMYNLEDFSSIMHFSEIQGTNKIKNLNDTILYIYVKDLKGLDSSKTEIKANTAGLSIKLENVNDNKQHLKATFSLDKNEFSQNVLSKPIDWYSIAYNKEPSRQFSLTSDELPITLKRILLSTDEAGKRSFNIRPINLFVEKREVSLVQSEVNYTNYVDKPLTEIMFSQTPKISAEIEGGNASLATVENNSSESGHFTIQPQMTSEEKISDMEFKVLLKGNSGETLEVNRNIQLLPVFTGSFSPQSLNGEWGIPDKKSNYKKEVAIELQEAGQKYISKNGFSIYIHNPYKEELTFESSKKENFIVHQIGYSSNGDYVMVSLTFASSDFNYSTLPSGFEFRVDREKGISNDMGHIYNTWIPVEYIKQKITTRQSQIKITSENLTEGDTASSKESLESEESPEPNPLSTDEEFEYMDVAVNEESYSIGVTQTQLDWILSYNTIKEFASHLGEKNSVLYVKYDKVTGVEDIEQFVYDLAEQKQIDFKIKLENYPDENLLEITFTK